MLLPLQVQIQLCRSFFLTSQNFIGVIQQTGAWRTHSRGFKKARHTFTQLQGEKESATIDMNKIAGQSWPEKHVHLYKITFRFSTGPGGITAPSLTPMPFLRVEFSIFCLHLKLCQCQSLQYR